ncbi:uncharacterized protein METZ01_LOCUS194429, partial [marine metagenome]
QVLIPQTKNKKNLTRLFLMKTFELRT